MHRQLTILFCVLLSSLTLSAQEKPTAKPAAKPASHAAAPGASAAGLPSEDTVNSFLHDMFAYDPDVSWKVLEIKPSVARGLSEVDVIVTGPQGPRSIKFYVSADGAHAISGEISPFGPHPFAAAQAELRKKMTGPSQGPPSAPVMVVEFSDLQCPHCKQAQPTIDKLMSESKNARLVFQSFPIPTHDWAQKAAEYADCIGRTNNDAFWKFIHSVYDAQKDITAANADEKLNGLTDAAGAKSADIAVCAAKPETAGRVERSLELGRSLDVTGTPTLFINGRKIDNVGGISYDVLKGLVDFAEKEAK
ncbi:MAG: thioredoxin domain-containing protein [Acidobacteriia bacterium]|nr:thioredoxin domain-containing protein [Terriglobia bacterium]